MADCKEPLLHDEHASPDDIDHLEQDLEAGSADGVTFQQLLCSSEVEVIKYLARKGVKRLGTFKIPDHQVLDLLPEGALLTRGSAVMEDDYEAVWRRQLAARKRSKKSARWSNLVEVEAHVVTIRGAAAADADGILNPLVEKWQQQGTSVNAFGLPAVQAVVDFKWHTWAYRLLLWEMAVYALWLFGFQAFTLTFQDEDVHASLGQVLATGAGRFTFATLLASTAAMVPFMYVELCTWQEYGRGWWSLWNLLDIAAYVNQAVIVVCYITRSHLDSDVLSVVIALQILVLWWKIQYFARVFQSTKDSFVDTLRQVIFDIKGFLVLLLLTMWGFASAFHILLRKDQASEEFSNPARAMVAMFTTMLGDTEVQHFYKSHNPVVGTLLFLLYIFVTSVVLLNCLVGIICAAWDKSTENESVKFYCSRAQIIDELETTVPRVIRSRKPNWYPAYVHILKVHPASAEQVALEHVWRSGELEEEAGDPMEALTRKVESLEGQLARVLEGQEALKELLAGTNKQRGWTSLLSRSTAEE